MDDSDFDIPPLQAGADIGQALREARERQKLTLDEVADITRVRRAYLADLEAMRLDRLPSRPFTIGYVRAYAEALGLDGEAAVERFKSDEPDLNEPLRAPIGVGDVGDPRVVAIVAAVFVILAAIIVWNVAQRTLTANAPPPPTAPPKAAALALATQTVGPIKLGAPLPAPVESTTPPPYETPGAPTLNPDGTVTAHITAGSKSGLTPETQPAVDLSTLPPNFQPNGKIYGAVAPQTSVLTLQALKSASLVVRGQGGEIYFARQFAQGEAYRAPQIAGLTAEVSQPGAFQVFIHGQSKGVLPAAQVSLNKLAEQAP